MLDELASAGRENLDPSHVELYDSKEDADAVAEVEFCRWLGLDADWQVVDLGAGTGQFAAAVADHCARVVAVDVSPVMRRSLRSRLGRLGVTNVDVVDAGFLTFDRPEKSVDLVYSRYALHHLPDAWKTVALSRIHRMLRPGGLLRLWDVVYSVEPDEFEGAMEAWASAFPVEPRVGEWGREDVAEHVRDEHSTFTWILEPMLERIGFAIDRADYSHDRMFARYVASRV